MSTENEYKGYTVIDIVFKHIYDKDGKFIGAVEADDIDDNSRVDAVIEKHQANLNLFGSRQ